MSGACPVCLTIFSKAYSLSLTAPSLSFSLRGLGTLCCLALFRGWSSRRGVGDGSCETLERYTVCWLPLSSILIILLWAMIIRHGPLVRAWSLLYACFSMASVEASSTVRTIGSSTMTYDPSAKGLLRRRQSLSSLYLGRHFCILASTLARK